MRPPKLELMKLKRAIAWQGSNYTFSRFGLNAFKEPSDEVKSSITISGLYHETSGYVKTTTQDATEVRSKPQPMILALYSESKDLLMDDVVIINGKTYKVKDINNLNNLGIIGDVSMEVVV